MFSEIKHKRADESSKELWLFSDTWAIFVTHHVIYVFARLFHSFAGVANGFHSNQR